MIRENSVITLEFKIIVFEMTKNKNDLLRKRFEQFREFKSNRGKPCYRLNKNIAV